MSAMPERVQKYLCAWEGGLLLIDEGFGPDVFVKHNDYAALESRLLAAEARVREVEAERDGLARHIDRRADGMDPLTQALRADRDALVPLARLGMLAREMYGMGELELDADLEGTAIKAEWDSLIAATDKARAILAREGA